MRNGERQTYKNRYGVRITVTKTHSGTVVLRAHSKTTRNFWWTFSTWDEVFEIGHGPYGALFTNYSQWASATLAKAHDITPAHVL